MIPPDELQRRLRQRPFQPFRLRLADGRTFDIRFAHLNLVGRDFVVIGIPESNSPDTLYQYTEIVPLSLISDLESLSETVSPVTI